MVRHRRSSTSGCGSSASTPPSRWPATGRWSASGPRPRHRTAELLPPGTEVRLERDVEARDRYGRLLAYVFRAADDAASSTCSSCRRATPGARLRPNVTRQPSSHRGRAADGRAGGEAGTPMADRSGGTDVAAPAGGQPTSRHRTGSVGAVTTLAERLGLRPRRPPAHHQLRRPRARATPPTSASTRRCATASPPAPR